VKLIIQIPCLNESATLSGVLDGLPDSIPGIREIETLVIDDGSTDGTATLAGDLHVDHVIRHKQNRGLAAAFATGLDACLRRGADIIVNIDADGQYSGSDIPRLVKPIVDGDADVVVGDRAPVTDMRQSRTKRSLNRFGQFAVSYLAGREIPDPVSGFRAMSRQVALRTHIATGFSYTIESLLQFVSKGFAVQFIPVQTNVVGRPSRLFRSIPQFLWYSGATMLRVFFMFRPLTVLLWVSGVLFLAGSLPILRFLIYWTVGDGDGHIQSLVLGGALTVLSCVVAVAGLLGDLIATNRQLLESSLERIKALEIESATSTDPMALRRETRSHM
jgi:glycosyltransferase involved in cell wall biosynthesis